MEPRKTEWFTAKEVCSRLDMDPRLFREYVEKRIFPVGVKRGKAARAWSITDVEWMIYREQNQLRFEIPKDSDKRDEGDDIGESE